MRQLGLRVRVGLPEARAELGVCLCHGCVQGWVRLILRLRIVTEARLSLGEGWVRLSLRLRIVIGALLSLDGSCGHGSKPAHLVVEADVIWRCEISPMQGECRGEGRLGHHGRSLRRGCLEHVGQLGGTGAGLRGGEREGGRE